MLGINYAPEIIGTSVYTTGLVEALAESGDRVRVITAKPSYPAWRIFDGWKGGWRRSTPKQGVTVHHIPLYVPAQPSGAKRMLHYISFALTSFPLLVWAALRDRPDMVMVIAPSLVSAPCGLLAARLAGARTWLHVQDFEVEAAFATGLLPEQGLVGRMARGFERWVLRRFDRASSISAPMLAKLRDKGVPDESVFELRNWADLAKVQPLEGPSPLKAELGITTPYVALYSGNIARKQGLEILLDVARSLAHRDDLTIAVCGDGPFLAEMKSRAEGFGNVHFFPLQPLERLSDSLGMADVHLLPQIAGAADLVLPSKLTNMLASGRPVVATVDQGTALAEEVEGCGGVTPPGEAERMAEAIEELLDNEQERVALGRAARVRAYERWDQAKILERFRDEAERLCDAGEGSSLGDSNLNEKIGKP